MASSDSGMSYEAPDSDLSPVEERDQYQHACPAQSQRLARKSSHRTPGRAHPNHKPFTCTVSPQPFSRAHDSGSHDRRRTGGHRFVCSWRSRTGHAIGCQRSFLREANFKRHLLKESNRGCLKSISANLGPFQSMNEAADYFVKMIHPSTTSTDGSSDISPTRSPHESSRPVSRCLAPVRQLTINTKCADYQQDSVIQRHAKELLTPDSLQSMDEDFEAFFRIESLKRALSRKGESSFRGHSSTRRSC